MPKTDVLDAGGIPLQNFLIKDSALIVYLNFISKKLRNERKACDSFARVQTNATVCAAWMQTLRSFSAQN